MEQMSIIPASRKNDPPTSSAAEAHINSTGIRASQQQQVLDALRQHPQVTSRELADLTKMDRYMIAKRLPELRPHKVSVIGSRRCAVSGRPAQVWVAKSAQT